MDFVAIAKEISTDRLQDSTVQKYLGAVVKHPNLTRNTYYIMRIWMLVGSRSDNPYRLVRFLGAGKDITSLYDRIPPLKELKSDEAYFFENPVGEPWRVTRSEGVLALNNDFKQRTTFSALLTEPSLELLQPLRPVGQHVVRTREIERVPGPRNTGRLVIPVTPRTSRSERLAEQDRLANLTLAQARDLFRKHEPAVYQDALLARFHRELDRTAKHFSTKVSGSEYFLDGFCPSVIAPIDSVDSAIFMKQAKQAGAFEVLAYKRLVNNPVQAHVTD